MRTRKLVFCAVAVALAYLTSYIRLFELPWGGSVTLCSMLFIVLIGYWYGPAAGMATGFVFPPFRCAAITCLPLRPWGSPDFSESRNTD